MTVHKRVAEELGMAIPLEDIDDDSSREIVSVSPHEIVSADNPDLPPMHDIEQNLIEAEKQLEIIYSEGMETYATMIGDISQIEPKYRARAAEMAASFLGHAKDAVMHKSLLQLRKAEFRLKAASFSKNRGSAKTPDQVNQTAVQANNVFFTGTATDLMQQFARVVNEVKENADSSVIDVEAIEAK